MIERFRRLLHRLSDAARRALRALDRHGAVLLRAAGTAWLAAGRALRVVAHAGMLLGIVLFSGLVLGARWAAVRAAIGLVLLARFLRSLLLGIVLVVVIAGAIAARAAARRAVPVALAVARAVRMLALGTVLVLIVGTAAAMWAARTAADRRRSERAPATEPSAAELLAADVPSPAPAVPADGPAWVPGPVDGGVLLRRRDGIREAGIIAAAVPLVAAGLLLLATASPLASWAATAALALAATTAALVIDRHGTCWAGLDTASSELGVRLPRHALRAAVADLAARPAPTAGLLGGEHGAIVVPTGDGTDLLIGHPHPTRTDLLRVRLAPTGRPAPAAR